MGGLQVPTLLSPRCPRPAVGPVSAGLAAGQELDAGAGEARVRPLSPAVPQAMVLTLGARREEVVTCYQGTPPRCGEGTAQESARMLSPALEASTTEQGACCVGRPLPPAVMVVQGLGCKAGLLRVAAM